MAEKNPSTNCFNDEKIRLRKKNEDKIRFNRLINDQRSTIQCSTIHEGQIYHSNHLRRTSLSIPCQSSSPSPSLSPSPSPSPSTSTSTSINSFGSSRKKFQSFYRSLIPSKSSTNESNKKSSDNSNRKEMSKISSLFPSSPLTSLSSSSSSNRKSMRERNYRYSLPDTSTRTFILKNLRQKNRKLPMKISSADESIRSTFQNLLSLVKFPSNPKSNSCQSTSSSTISSFNPIIWNFHNERSEWISSVGIGKIRLSSIELHNLTSIEIEYLQKMIVDKFERSSIDLNIPFHLLKDEPIRKRKHHFMFRSKSTDKSKEKDIKDKDKDKETKSNGNVFGIALSELIQDNQENRFDDSTKLLKKPDENLSDRSETTKLIKEKYLSPSASSSSINDSGYSLSPTSPTSFHISDGDYQEKKYRSVSLEGLAIQESSSGINRSNTLRCYPAKVPELIRTCCHYIEQNGLQTVGLFRVGVSKKRLKELKDQINTNRTLTFDSSTNVHDVAGLIKEFLRELPEPLLTRHLSLPLIHIRTRIPIEEQNDVLADLIRLLPSSNRDTLYELLKFLHHVSLNSQDRYSSDGKLLSLGNKMDTENLAIVFAPTILLDNKITKDSSSISINAEQIEQGKDILRLMIEHYKELFMIEKCLHDQICYSINEIDREQFNRLLAFKLQNGCGISSIELDDENDEYLKSIDLKCLSMNEISIENGISSPSPSPSPSIFNKNSKSEMKESTTQRRYNLRRNSDFPRSSYHSSRSSEYLQVPLSKSQQRLTTNSSSSSSDQQSKSSPRIRDIREARMDQILFRFIDPEFVSSTRQFSNEPIINITSHDEQISSIASAAAALATAKGTTIASSTDPTTTTTTTTMDLPLVREVKSYSRSKTTPLAFLSDGKQLINAKKCEAKDLCGTSSNESTK